MSQFDVNTTVLIIEDSHTVRQSLRTMLSNVGIIRSEASVNASDGLQRIRRKTFDIVLCDYNLGEGMNGQELLELLRRGGEYPLTSVWIMITGERKYERVVAAAEVAPDDYILKPFSSQLLFERLHLALTRKLFLRPAHLKLMSGDPATALVALKQLEAIAETPVQVMDVLRLMAETYMLNDQYVDAGHVYQKILSMKAIPWAKMGMVRVLREQGDVEKSTALLNEIIAEAPSYTDAYDALAHNLSYSGEFEQALGILEKAVELSPRNFQRLCICGETALNVGDPAKAAFYLEKAVQIGRNNSAFGPHVLVDLLQAYSEDEQLDRMDKVAQELSGLLKGEDDRFILLVCRAMSLLARKNDNEAAALLSQAAMLLPKARTDWRDARRFIEAVVRLPADIPGHVPAQWVSTMALRFVKNHQDVGLIVALSRGNESLIQAVNDAYARLQEANDQAMAMAKDGRKQAAAQMLFDAAGETFNDRLGMNACSLLLQDGTSASIEKVMQLLRWLPAEHERVKGFNATLAKLDYARQVSDG